MKYFTAIAISMMGAVCAMTTLFILRDVVGLETAYSCIVALSWIVVILAISHFIIDRYKK